MEGLQSLFNLTSDKIKKGQKLKDLKEVIKSYDGDDWKDYVLFCDDKYHRNTVYSNDNIELIIISWNNNQISGVHDHPENGCLIRILQGELVEEIYEKKNDGLEFKKSRNYKKDSIGYQEGETGLHNIQIKDNKTVSLHIYSPPNYKSNKY